jgi:hypothetical protein
MDSKRMGIIPVFYSFARSGGTLINQSLGCHPANAILSEVNPGGAFKSIAKQGAEWLGLFGASEVKSFSALSYGEQISKLYERAELKKRKLIIRDWCTINFMPLEISDLSFWPCSMVLEQEIYLRAAGFLPRPIVIARDAASVYLSIKQAFPKLRNLDISRFGTSYLAYAHAIGGYPIFKLEDFRKNPGDVLPMICRQLDVHFPDNFEDQFFRYNSCTGNNTLETKAASQSAQAILPMDSARTPEWTKAAEHPLLAEANRILGYEQQ